MNSILLSRITKNYFNQSQKPNLRMAWSGSILSTHPQARSPEHSFFLFGSLLESLKRKISQFLEQEEKPINLSTSPRLKPPILPEGSHFQPPCYFTKGALENDPRKNPAPIPYLLTESNETSLARPVPGNNLLLRSLCKGKGVLRKNSQGLVYLDIDNRFISSQVPLLKAYGLVRPPYFNLFYSPDGAHAPVIPAREMAFQYLDEIKEVGEEFSFEIEGLYSLEPSSWPEVEQVWFFKLRSPELEKLRRRYFLPALPGGHAFHIAVAVKGRPTTSVQPKPLPLMRINVGFLAA